MKKLIALLLVCGFAVAFVSCGSKSDEAKNQDSVAVEPTPAPVEPAPEPVDTTAADTTAM